MPSPHVQKLIDAARAKHAALLAEKAAKQTVDTVVDTVVKSSSPTIMEATSQTVSTVAATPLLNATKQNSRLNFNAEQRNAIEAALQAKSFCLIGAAGTGKTTVTQEIIQQLQQSAHVLPLTEGTKHLVQEAPGIVVLGFTNKAVNNIKKKLPEHIARHCLTFHKVLEFQPVYYDVEDEETGATRKSMQFEPKFCQAVKLPHISTVIIEEGSMVGTDLFAQFIAALPYPQRTQFIFLGDLNQLPPIFGPSILGFKLNELLTVELTHVYRQALQSPIISLATSIRLNLTKFGRPGKLEEGQHYLPSNLADTVKLDNGEHGVVTLHPWKKRVDWENANAMMKKFIPTLIETGKYNPDEDMILIPFNKQFGTLEVNRIIADYLGKKREAVVYEVRARYDTSYWAVGDRVMVDRHEAIITDIYETPGYAGKSTRKASTTMDRWGKDPKNDEQPEARKMTAEEIHNILDKLAVERDEESKNLASHTITVMIGDTGETKTLKSAGEINSMTFGWALTVHKSQGSEWQRVFLFLHNSHAKGSLLSRELLYTAVTRAKHELYVICEGDMGKYTNSIIRAADRPVITGTTLKEKAEWFKGKEAQMRNILAAASGESTADVESMDD